jgi:hypothetical protein
MTERKQMKIRLTPKKFLVASFEERLLFLEYEFVASLTQPLDPTV